MVRLDRELFDYALAVRGLTATRLSELSGVPEATISGARNGKLIRGETLRVLGITVSSQPELPGAELLLRAPRRDAHEHPVRTAGGLTPEQLERAASRLVAQAVAQGLPEKVSDPAVLAHIADIIRDVPIPANEDGPAVPRRRAVHEEGRRVGANRSAAV